MKKLNFAILLTLANIFALYACQNISAQDFGPNDVVNILEVIVSKDGYDHIPEAATAAETDFTEPTLITDFAEETEETAQGPATTAVPVSTETTEKPTAPPTEKPAEPDNPLYEAGAPTVINIRDVFPEAPEKFWGIPYPESVPMLDSLKAAISGLSGFAARDFNKFSFYVATTDAKLFTPIYGSGMFSDARRYRTEIVSAECSIEIHPIEKPIDAVVQEIKAAVLADDYYADILCLPFYIQSELIGNGLLMNLKKIPFLNVNAEYYNASATEAFTVNGNIFGLVSDLTFDPSTVYAMFYNRTLVKKYGLTNPLKLYKDGSWNYDSMFAAAKELTAAVADLNSAASKVYSIGIDKENNDIINGLFISSGNKYFAKRDYNYPVLNFANEKTSKLIDAISQIFAPADETGMDNFMGAGGFDGGNILFSAAKLDMISDITESKFDWGVLPVPSLEGHDKLFSFADRGALCISVLRYARNTEACGVVVSSLSAASHNQLKDIYVKEQMTYHLRDVYSVETLGDIVHSLAFNQYSAYSTMPEIYGATVGAIKDAANRQGAFADIYEKNKANLSEFFRNSRFFDRS